jgi:hypothetical protein
MTDEELTLDSVEAAARTRWDRHRQVLEWDTAWRIRGPEDPFIAAQEIAHHGHWSDHAFAGLRARVERTPAPPRIEDLDGQNAAWADEDAALTYDDARDRTEAILAKYTAYVRSVPTEHRDRAVRGLHFLAVEHFDAHFGFMVTGLLEHESAGWERLTAILDARPEGVLHTGEDGQDWTAAAIYAHLERWMAVNMPRVDAFLAAGPDGSVPDLQASVDELNARWVEEDAALSFAEARQRAFRSRDHFVAQIRSVPADRWTPRLVGLYMGNAWGHYNEHLAYFGE